LIKLLPLVVWSSFFFGGHSVYLYRDVDIGRKWRIFQYTACIRLSRCAWTQSDCRSFWLVWDSYVGITRK